MSLFEPTTADGTQHGSHATLIIHHADAAPATRGCGTIRPRSRHQTVRYALLTRAQHRCHFRGLFFHAQISRLPRISRAQKCAMQKREELSPASERRCCAAQRSFTGTVRWQMREACAPTHAEPPHIFARPPRQARTSRCRAHFAMLCGLFPLIYDVASRQRHADMASRVQTTPERLNDAARRDHGGIP